MNSLRGSCASEALPPWIRANSQHASSLAHEPSAGILRVRHSSRCALSVNRAGRSQSKRWRCGAKHIFNMRGEPFGWIVRVEALSLRRRCTGSPMSPLRELSNPSTSPMNPLRGSFASLSLWFRAQFSRRWNLLRVSCPSKAPPLWIRANFGSLGRRR